MFELGEIQEIFGVVKEFVPFVQQIVDTVFEFTPAIKQLVEAAQDWSVQRNIKMLNDYTLAGLTREDALALVLSGQVSLKEVMSNISVNKK